MARFIAHRGFSSRECENTLNAFKLAVDGGYYGVECDVHITSDKNFVIFHDDSTGRLCTQDISVENSTLNQLQSLVFKCGEGYKIPTLQEYLSALSSGCSRPVIEFKNPMQPAQIMRVIEICRQYIPLEKIIFISFHIENLITVRRALPVQEIQLLTCSLSYEVVENLIKYNFGADVDKIIVTEEVVEKLHSKNIPVNVWTCEDKAEVEKFISFGVDFITTNTL